MNILQLTWKNLRAKPLNAMLNILLVATGIFIISFVLILEKQTEQHLERNAANINLVVGAKGSPLQLILSSIYQVDYPTGNIKLSEAEQISKNPLVKKTIPLALGDNFKGFRIVGTTHDYPMIYDAKLAVGKLWKADMEVSIGAKVAMESGLKIGDKFAGVHGFMAESNDVHNESQYMVSGIYAPSNSVLDQLILTNVSSVWQIHGSHHHGTENDDAHQGEHDEDHDEHCAQHDHNEHQHDDTDAEAADKEITALLVFYRNPMAAVTLPRQINQNTNMQAASPVIEMNRLYSLMGIGIESANLIAYLIMLISAFSIFISLYNSMKERKYELALIRVLGGRKRTVFSLVLLEGLTISFVGFITGYLLSICASFFISIYSESNFHYGFNNYTNLGTNLILLGMSLLIGFTASVIPAIKSMRTNLSKTLDE